MAKADRRKSIPRFTSKRRISDAETSAPSVSGASGASGDPVAAGTDEAAPLAAEDSRRALALAYAGLARLYAHADPVLRSFALDWVEDLAGPLAGGEAGRAALRESGMVLFAEDASAVDLGLKNAARAHRLGIGLTVYDFAYLREQRFLSQKIGLGVRMLVVTTILTAALTAIWLGIQVALKKGGG